MDRETKILIAKSIISSKKFNKIYEELSPEECKTVDDIWNNALDEKIKSIKSEPIKLVAEP